MPQTLDHPAERSARFAPVPVRYEDPPEEEELPVASHSDEEEKAGAKQKSWPFIILTSGATGATATILAGSVVGPLGALAAGVAGVVLGVLIQRSQKSNMEVHR